MLILSKRLENAPVLSLQTGTAIAALRQPIVDPRRLQISAFYCTGPRLDTSPAVLHTDDIREYSELGVVINDSDDIMGPDDLVRLQEVIGFNFQMLNKPVIDTTQKKVGKVSDYVVDTDSFAIQKLIVRRPLLRSLNEAEVIIDRTQIAEITDDAIIVNAPTVTDEKSSPLTRLVDNPFKKAAQPEQNLNRN